MSSHLQIIADLESVTEVQARTIRILATRLAELGDTETGKDEIAEADRIYKDIIGDDEWLKDIEDNQEEARKTWDQMNNRHGNLPFPE